MFTKIKKQSEGFTIIEVLIVLAIAGLIMLIVFLAVPALQRNSRNTTIKNDASSLAGGFSEYVANNNGLQPASIAYVAPTVTIGAAATNTSAVQLNGATAVVVAKTKPAARVYDTLYWQTGTTCSGAASPRAIVVYYYVESGSASTVPSCVDAS